MRIEIAPGVRVYVDVQNPGLVPAGPPRAGVAAPEPDGSAFRELPTLLVLHGGPGFDHSSFKPAFARLADVAQVVYLDHRGHGRSDRRPAAEWTLDTFADDVVRVCGALGIERPVVLGQSFGGFVAQRYLARHPAHPRAVVLSSTSGTRSFERKVAMFRRLGGEAAAAAAAAFWSAPSEATWAPYGVHCRALYNTTPQPERHALFVPEILYAWSGGEGQRMNLLPGLAAVQCPVLVLTGDTDPVCPQEDSADIHAALPERWRELAVIEGAGHGTWRDRPDAAMAVLRGFIARVAPAATVNAAPEVSARTALTSASAGADTN